MKLVQLDQIPLSAFESAVHGQFRATHADESPIELQLLEVIRPAQPDTAPFECFSLRFIGPPERLLAQGIVRLEHDRLGSFELFLVPIAREAAGIRYEAVFNRSRSR